MKFELEFKAKVWLYPGMAGWHFITVPKDYSFKIKNLFGQSSRGFGSIPVIANIGITSWSTSIFPSSEFNGYLLPLKSQVRKKENITENSEVNVKVQVV